MKKNIIAVLLCTISFWCNAQKNNYGLTVGGNCSDFLSRNVGRNYTTRSLPGAGYVIGGYYCRLLNEKYRLQTGFNWITKNSRYEILGVKSKYPDVTGNPIGNTKQGYCQIPWTLAYSKNECWDFYGGIYLGITWDNFYNELPYFIGFETNEDVFPSYNNCDHGLQIGLAYKADHFKVNIDYSQTINTNLVLNLVNQHFHTLTLSINYLIKKQIP